MQINKKELRQAVNDKMFTEMALQQKKIGLRVFADEVGVSLGTLARFIKGTNDNIELGTLELICDWLKKPITDFLEVE